MAMLPATLPNSPCDRFRHRTNLSSAKGLQQLCIPVTHFCISVTHSGSPPQYNLRRPPKNSYSIEWNLHMKKPILTRSHESWVTRALTQIGYRVVLAATLLLALGSSQLVEAQTTIQVTTT